MNQKKLGYEKEIMESLKKQSHRNKREGKKS